MPVLQLIYEDLPIACEIDKIDRSKLYGYIDTEILDEKGRPCRLATIASDGRTLLPSGGIALAYVSPNGLWRDKSDLKAVNPEGALIEAVVSTFKKPIILNQTANVEDLLDHNIRMTYLLTPEGDGAAYPAALMSELAAGKIYTFPFSYRGGLTPDTAFLIGGTDGMIWMLVGRGTRVQLLGFEQQAALAEEAGDEEEADSEDIDFGMM